MRWGVLASLPALQLATFSEEQIFQAKRNLRMHLHHIGAEGGLIDEFVERLWEAHISDTDNQHDIKDWTETTTSVSDWNGRGDVLRTTFLSPQFKLKTGGAHFTLNPTYKVPVPEGDYVILNQTWDIVGDDDAGVPLSQMYNHHWLIGGEDWPTSLCEGDYFFGGGAEYRNMDYTYPEGYGQARVAAKGKCGANLHFINVENLATEWKGFNNPNGSAPAATKLAAECGFEPGRADGLCENWGDGSFLCCFTDSRAKVQDPKDKTKRSYRLKATFEYTRDFSTTKHLQMSLLDVGGNLRTEHGQILDAINEWGVASNLNNEGVFTRCNDTVCTATRSQVVGDGSKYGYGICSGDMVWGYMHMHAGGIQGTMAINGEDYCTSLPGVGTDPTNPIGNEQGFLVKVTECVDHKTQGNKIRLNQGDVVTLTQTYDVDPASQRQFPFPGGKHGGVMALFFAMMDCDAGTFDEIYVKRNDTCVPTPSSKKRRVGDHYDTLELCQAGVLAKEEETVEESQALVAVDSDPEEPELPFKGMNLLWRDCGGPNKAVNITGLDKKKLHIGRKNKISMAGQLSRPITKANVTLKFASGALGLTLGDIDGEACSSTGGFWTLVHNIHLKWQPLGCPLQPGDFSGRLDVYVSPLIPKLIGHTTTTLVAHDGDDQLFCLEVVTTNGDTPNGNQIPEIVI